MRSNGDRDTVIAVLDRYEAAASAAAELGFDGLTTPELLGVLERLERIGRRHPVLGHDVINRLDHFAPSQELGGTLAHALADRLRIGRAEARRRIGEAADLGARATLAGEVAVIRGFLAQLPGWVDAPTRQRSEATLAELSTQFRPEQVRRAAAVLAGLINPDGQFSDQDRARRRGILIGAQDP